MTMGKYNEQRTRQQKKCQKETAFNGQGKESSEKSQEGFNKYIG